MSTQSVAPLAAVCADGIEFFRGPRGQMQLRSELWLPYPRSQIFEFFSDAFQLETLTPSFLNFRVVTPPPIRIERGARIDYRLRLRGIPLSWQSHICEWDPPYRFADEQARGPYRRWYHVHSFETLANGTLCRDVVNYQVWGGRWIERWLVRPDLRRIFAYRRKRMQALFPADGAGAPANEREHAHV